MFRYILKRITWFIPTLIIISLITFYLVKLAPGDPLINILYAEGMVTTGEEGEMHKQLKEEYRLNLPVFYFGIGNLARPDTFYRIQEIKKERLQAYLYYYGNWKEIAAYLHRLEQVRNKFKNEPGNLAQLNKLNRSADPEKLNDSFKEIYNSEVDQGFLSYIYQLEEQYKQLHENSTRWKNYIPVINFYGWNNQYHHWIINFIKGDWGYSFKNNLPVNNIVGAAFKWTLLITGLAILFAFLIAVPLGVISATTKQRWLKGSIIIFLLILYSLPTFWIATLLIIFLGGGDYLDIFPAYGVTERGAEGLWQKVVSAGHHLILPLICWVYPSLAFISRQVKGNMVHVMMEEYIKTARAKGLPAKKVIWKHAFRNILLTLITLFSLIVPAAIGGSVVIETIFSIPGIGRLGYEAVLARDYPVIYAVVMVIGFFTVTVYLISDILYAYADPRISYGKDR